MQAARAALIHFERHPEDSSPTIVGTDRRLSSTPADRYAMNTPEHSLTRDQIAHFAQRIAARKSLLLDEIREGLARSGNEHVADLLGGTGDSGDAAAASLLRDINESEIVRDVGEVRDIAAAEQRLASGRFGICIDCDEPIRFKRLDAYPTAKRCLACQERREKLQAPSRYTGR